MSETAAKQSVPTKPLRAPVSGGEQSSSGPGGVRSAALALQRSAGNRAVTGLLTQEPGTPLDPSTRSEMEAKLRHDFSNVRIHQGREATNLTAAAGARAVTSGNDIAFNRGFYAPRSAAGRRLIAHELTHVVQQSGRARGGGKANAELEARAAGDRVADGESVEVEATASGVQADPLTKAELDAQIADNEARAEQTTSKDQLDQLFEERNALLAQRDAASAAATGGKPSNAQDQPVTPPPAKKVIRTDYAADEHAYSGVDLEYAAKGDYTTTGVTSPGVYKARHYWIAPHLRVGSDKVVYYIAYNPDTKRNEFVIGPDKIQDFLANEEVNHVIAAGAYPLVGELPKYKALSGRVGSKIMRGDVKGAFDAWKGSWGAAVRDPQFWLETTMATAGALAGGAKAPIVAETGVVESEVTSTAATVSNEASAVAADVPKTPAPASAAVTDTAPSPAAASGTTGEASTVAADAAKTTPPPAAVAKTPPPPAAASGASGEGSAVAADAAKTTPPPPAPAANAAPPPAAGATSEASTAAADVSKTTTAAAPTTATTTEEVFAELDKELKPVPEAAGEPVGTSRNQFESPKPLQNQGPAVLKSPNKPGVPLRESAGASPRGSSFQSASAQTRRSLNTAIRSDVGEAAAYKDALERGEIGLQRPGGSNVPGSDFITAVEESDGIRVYANDAKTSVRGKFPRTPGEGVKPSWQAEVDNAVKKGRLNLGDPELEDRIRDAVKAGRVSVRQVNVDYSPAGQGGISLPPMRKP